MELNRNELDIILEGLIMLDNVDSCMFHDYGINYNEFFDKIEQELKSKS